MKKEVKTESEKEKCYQKLKYFLNWSIRPDNNSYYPALRCYKAFRPIYETGLIKDKKGKVTRLSKSHWDCTLDTLDDKDMLPGICNIKDIFEHVVKDFNMPDEDKPHLWKLLTDFTIEKFYNLEISYDFLNFLFKYNFRISILK